MAFPGRFKRETDQHEVPPLPILVSPLPELAFSAGDGDDAELELKYRVALMMQSLTEHVMNEIDVDAAPLRDDYYIQALRLGRYAASLLEMKQDPNYEFKPVPELRFPELEPVK
jgi:hypothetical protein